MSQLNLPPGAEREGVDRLKKFMTVMDALTDDELDSKVKLDADDSRILRVARGAGTSPVEIYLMLQQHKQFEKMIGSLFIRVSWKKCFDVFVFFELRYVFFIFSLHRQNG